MNGLMHPYLGKPKSAVTTPTVTTKSGKPLFAKGQSTPNLTDLADPAARSRAASIKTFKKFVR